MDKTVVDHPAVAVRATLPRRRRAGLLFTREPVTIPAGTLTQTQVEQLQSDPHLVLRPADEAEADGSPKSEGPADPEARRAAIAGAVSALGEGDLTKDGKPKVAALEKALGWKPAKDEIDAATAPQE